MKWIVQTNLGSMIETSDNIKIESACKKYGFEFEGVNVIPFSGDIPKFNIDDPIVFYGGTGWINNIYNKYPNHKGIFFNPKSVFTYWIKKYGSNALNHGALETTINEFSKLRFDDDEMFFIRPVSDQKEFNGGVMNFGDIKKWDKKIISYSPDLVNIPIIISTPYRLEYEWRVFILNGKVITGSQYRTYNVLNVNPNIPQKVINFAENQAKIYSPAYIFVMDICKCGELLYILEIGCFNSAGFYASNIELIVNKVSNYVKKIDKETIKRN